MRDMVPNHIFQLISLMAMEPPVSFDADVVRDEQAKILKAIPPMTPEEVLSRTVRGQYGEGSAGETKLLPYRSELDVSPTSKTETYVALKLFVDNWRWADVPFYIRTGKHMPKRVTEISIQFKRAPFLLFRQTSVEKLTPNRLVLMLQPDEGISLSFGAKIPGPLVRMGNVKMDFHYKDYFGPRPAPATNVCCTIACSATRPCFSDLTWWRPPGAWSRPFRTFGKRCLRANSKLRGRHLGTRRGRRDAGARQALLE